MITRISLTGFLLFGVLLFGAGTVHAAGDPDEGKRIATRWCTSCHIIGKGVRGGDAAPPFVALSANPAKSERYLRAWITNPHPPMPNFNLTRRAVIDLVAYIKSLSERSRSIPAK